MASHPEMGFEPRLTRVAARLGLAVVVVGLLVLVGWALDIALLKSLVPGLTTMRPNTAVGFVLVGTSLWLTTRHSGARPAAWLARGLAAIVGALALATLWEYGFGADLGIDQVLFAEAVLEEVPFPGRMAEMTAVNFTLLAAAVLLLDVETRAGRRPGNWLLLVVSANSFLALLGYLYGVDALFRVAAFTAVALPTALLFLLVSLGIACARPSSPFIRRITSDNVAGQVNRRLLPMAILLPPLLGWLAWQGELAGYYSTAFRLALFAISNVAVFVVLIWFTARLLQRSHDRRRAVVETSAWQQAILNSADFTVISTDTDGTIRTVNAGVANLLGYTAEELVGRQTPAIIHDGAEIAARAQALSQELGRGIAPGFEAFVAKVRGGGSDENDWTYVGKDGSRHPVRLSVTALVDSGGALTGFLGIGKDISHLKLAEEALRATQQQLAASERRLRAVTDAVPALISYVDLEGRFQFSNATHARWLGQPLGDITGQRLDEVYDASTYELMRPHLEAAFAGRLTTFEYMAPAFGRFIRGTFLPDLDAQQRVLGVYALIDDMTEQKEVEGRLRQLAQFDSLTGLANRNRFDDKLAEAIARSERSGESLALMFLDIDRFKTINDSFGHQGGDLALQEFAARVSGSLRATDTVARLAGDEFVVILEQLGSAAEASLVATKIIAAVGQPFQIAGRSCALSTSIGVALRYPGEVDAEALLARSDAMLYQAKAAGRSGYVIQPVGRAAGAVSPVTQEPGDL